MPLTVSEKGWVVIPADLRKKYKLHPGAQVSVVDYGGVLALVPAMAKPIRQGPIRPGVADRAGRGGRRPPG